MRFLKLIILFLVPLLANATTYNSDGSQADVASLISGAINGDTITLPSGSFTWTAGVTIPNTKYLNITGNGSGRVLGYSTTSIAVGTGTKVWTTTAGLSITNGQTLRVYRSCGELNGSGFGTGNPIYCEGTVTTYSGTTLTMDITSISAVTGTFTSWDICSRPNTTIINNAGSAIILTMTESTSGSNNISGIQFQLGTGTGGMIRTNYTSGGQPLLLHDCWLEIPTSGGDALYSTSNSGVVWNCSFYAPSFSAAPLAFHHPANSITNSWTTASTMGDDDTTGKNNFYFENCDFTALLNATDFDSNARAVVRYSTFKYAAVGTHGADTSDFGVRHWEVYNCTFIYDNQGAASPNNTWWFYVRGGTAAVSNNVIPRFNSGGTWGSTGTFNMTVMQLGRDAGPNGGWGVIHTSGRAAGWNYPAPRQVGMGYVTGAATLPAWASGGPYPGPGATWDGNLVTFGGSTYRSTAANTSTSDPVVNSGQWTNTGYASGRDSITYIGDSEPIYIWDNTPTGGSAISLAYSDYGPNNTNSVSTTATPITTDTTAAYVVLNRDIFYDTTGSPTSGEKPGYSYYTYPHPLRTDLGAPTLSSAVIPTGGTTITLNFSESCTTGAGGASGVTLSPSGGAATATYSSGSGSSAYVYSLSRTINVGETVTISYTQPGDGIEATDDQVDVASFSGSAVTNNSTQGGGGTASAALSGTVTLRGGASIR